MIAKRPHMITITLGLALLILAAAAAIGLRSAIASSLADLPAPVTYERFRLTLAPVGIELRGARVGSLPGLPIKETKAEKVRVAVELREAVTLLRGGRSLEDLSKAIRTLKVAGLEVSLSLPAYDAAVQTEALTVTAPRDGGPFTVESPGIALTVRSHQNEPVAYRQEPESVPAPESANPAPTTPSTRESAATVTLASRLERQLDCAVALASRLPRLSVRAGSSTIHLDDERAVLSGDLIIGEEQPLSANLRIAELPLVLFDQGGRGSILGGTLQGELEVAVQSREAAALTGSLRARHVSLSHRRIADTQIDLPELNYDFDATVSTRKAVPPPRLAQRVPGTDDPPPIGAGAPEDADLRGALEIHKGVLRVGSVEMDALPVLSGLNAPTGELPAPLPARLDMELTLPETPLQDIVDAMPPALLGPLTGSELDGSVAWQISLEAPFRRLSWTWWEERSVVEGFDILRIDPAYDVRRLGGAFRHLLGSGNRRRVVVLPPSGGGPTREEDAPLLGSSPTDGRVDRSYRFVPYHEIAPAFIGAVVTAEDGEYFRHNGVNWRALTFAAQRNLLEGEVVVGGSTIPMQLAKNLFLDGDRVVARKLQELALVALANLSEAVTRERILEIYLNIIEFGPGVHGIAEASGYYFGRTASELTVEQSVWLASIIRSPHFLSRHATAGRVPPYWLERMEGIMEIMVERERLTEQELEAARGVQPEFAL